MITGFPVVPIFGAFIFSTNAPMLEPCMMIVKALRLTSVDKNLVEVTKYQDVQKRNLFSSYYIGKRIVNVEM
ncbi:hypothetical protein ACFLVM_01025 [Chloroflexota bacterium]